MGRFAEVHEHTRYEVIVRGIESRAEAEAIVLAVERMPEGRAWQPTPELSPEQEARMAAADPPEPIDVLNVDKAEVPG